MVKIAFLDKFGPKFGKNLKNKVGRMNLDRFNMTMAVSITIPMTMTVTITMTVTGKGHGNVSSL
jgi:hypothetical protein